ncbi:MAG: hypothetical protein J1E43_06285 [Christensenellaceae bacterium]|nr:hypothetical protein [Christensenellaceae bacterium]
MSKSLLEQLYDGELFPPEGISSSMPAYVRASDRAEKESVYLMSRLNEEDRRRFDEFIDIAGEMESCTAFANFAYGFRCGVMLMCELIFGKAG